MTHAVKRIDWNLGVGGRCFALGYVIFSFKGWMRRGWESILFLLDALCCGEVVLQYEGGSRRRGFWWMSALRWGLCVLYYRLAVQLC